MTIHHATKAKAEKLSIDLIEDENGVVTATTKTGATVSHTNAKLALEAVQLEHTFRAEYPPLFVGVDDSGLFEVRFHTDVVPGLDQMATVPSLDEVLEVVQEAGLDPEEGFEEEEEAERRVVVAPKYKLLYAEQGHPDHCGDWLALELEGRFETDGENGKPVFDADAFADMLAANGVELVGKWAELPMSGQKGWQGRYRMNGRQKLEPKIAVSGVLRMPNAVDVDVPDSYRLELLDRHPKAVAELSDEDCEALELSVEKAA